MPKRTAWVRRNTFDGTFFKSSVFDGVYGLICTDSDLQEAYLCNGPVEARHNVPAHYEPKQVYMTIELVPDDPDPKES